MAIGLVLGVVFLMTQATGPKISSWATVMSGVTSARTAGGHEEAGREARVVRQAAPGGQAGPLVQPGRR